MSARNRRARRSVSAALSVLVAGAAMLGAPVASAEPPVRLGTYVVDSAQALDSAQLDRVRGAVDNLYADQQLRLWIVYVRDFAGLGPQSWAEQTARKSGFGNRDLLLAVATQDRDYWFYGELPSGITDSDLSELLVGQVEPALRDGRWADAGIVTANRIDTELRGRTISARTLLIAGAVLAAVIAGFALYSRHRGRDRARAELAAARRVNPDDSVALAALPLDALHARSREALVELDNAIRTSSEELELAAGEFGATAAAPFRTALDHAKDAAAKAFSIRQRLDDEIPETPDEQRALLVDLLGAVGRADRELDAQVTEFDTMRNLLIDAPARLDALTRDLVALTGRIPASEAEWTRLTGALNEAAPSQRLTEPPPKALADEPESSPNLRQAESQPRALADERASVARQRRAEPQSETLADERGSVASQHRAEPQPRALADEREAVASLRQAGPPRQTLAYPAEALAPIADNIGMARERIAFAEQNIDAGRAALGRPVVNRVPRSVPFALRKPLLDRRIRSSTRSTASRPISSRPAWASRPRSTSCGAKSPKPPGFPTTAGRNSPLRSAPRGTRWTRRPRRRPPIRSPPSTMRSPPMANSTAPWPPPPIASSPPRICAAGSNTRSPMRAPE